MTTTIAAARSLITPVRPLGYSINFDGLHSSATLPITPSTTNFNIGFWVKVRTNSTTGAPMVDWESAADRNGFIIKMDMSARKVIAAFSSTTSADAILISPFDIGTWTHVAITYQANSAKLYVNSILAQTDTTVVMTSNANLVTLGNKSYTPGFANFLLGEFTFHNAAPWTLTQIQNLMNSGTIPSGASYYDFNQDFTDQNAANALTTINVGFIQDTPYPARGAV